MSQSAANTDITSTRSLERIVLWNLREGVSEAENQRVVDRARAVLAIIPSVESLTFGIATQPEAQYQYYVLIRFPDLDGMAAYDADPTHHTYVNNEFFPIVSDSLVISYRMQF